MSANLKEMKLRNEFLEKKIGLLQRREEEIQQILKLCPRSQAHLTKLSEKNHQNLEKVKENNEQLAKELKELINSGMKELAETKKQFDDLFQTAKNMEIVHLDEKSIDKIISFSFDSLSEKLIQTKMELKQNLADIDLENEELEQKITELQRKCESAQKEQQKMEKSNKELKELLTQKIEDFEAKKAENQRENEMKLKKIEEDFIKEEEETKKVLDELENLENEHKKRIESAQQNEKQQIELINRKLENLTAEITNIQSVEVCDEDSLKIFENHELFQVLMEKLKEIEEIKQEFSKEFDSIDINITEEENLEKLEAEYQQMMDEHNKIKDDIEQYEKEKEEHSNLSQILAAQTKILDDLEASEQEKSLKLIKLQNILDEQREIEKININNNDKEFIIRHVQVAPQNEIFPKMLESFKTPANKRRSMESNALTSKHFSNESDWTRPEIDISYPGIRPFSPTTLQKIEQAQMVTSLSKNWEINNAESFESSLNISQLSAETGTTNNGSLMGGMFSPLGNRTRNAMSSEDEPEQFSMMDHFREFNNRAALKSCRNENGSEATTTASFDSVSQRFSANIFLTDTGSSEVPTKDANSSSPNSMIVSPLNPTKENERTEYDDFYDDDDSLIATNDDEDLDQSVWGSDM